MGVGLVVLTGAIAVCNGRRDRFQNFVAAARPGATTIPALAESPRGLAGMAPTTIVLAVLDDHVEVWANRSAPLATIPLTGAEVGVQQVFTTRTQNHPGVRVANGAASVSFVPHYSALVNPSDVERALRELGEDPADHLR
jgi:hypothetical protein